MIQIKTFSRITCASLVLALFSFSSPSYAAEQVVDILPTTTHASEGEDMEMGDSTHPPVNVTPDRSELVYLDQDASSIIVGNPLHANVIADSSRVLVVVPRAPGATHFTVLDKNGQVIMRRHVIVASPKKDYVRVKRMCMEGSEDCQNTSVFYCPDTCHEVGIAPSSEDSGQSETDAGNNGTPPAESEEQAAAESSDQ